MSTSATGSRVEPAIEESILPLGHIYPYRPGDPVPAGVTALCGHKNTDDGQPSPPLNYPRMCAPCLERFYKRLHGEEAY